MKIGDTFPKRTKNPFEEGDVIATIKDMENGYVLYNSRTHDGSIFAHYRLDRKSCSVKQFCELFNTGKPLDSQHKVLIGQNETIP